MSMDEPILAAVRRAEQVFCEQVSQPESLEFGVAMTCGQFAASGQANQVREVVLGATPIADALECVDRFYAQRHLTCWRWVVAGGEPVEPHAAFLCGRGWVRRERLALALAEWPASRIDSSLRILPARAMRRAYRMTHLDAGDPCADDETKGAMADEANARLDDSNYDAFVALCGDVPAGRIAYHEVGDIAAVRDLYVVRALRGRGVARALMAHVLGLARRLGPRILVTLVDSDDAAGRSFLSKQGFRGGGVFPEFHRGLV